MGSLRPFYYRQWLLEAWRLPVRRSILHVAYSEPTVFKRFQFHCSMNLSCSCLSATLPGGA